tara:strand:- start:11212 stop:12459 length:1248 start_codon:yes stop_codon:yes gene_type:complete
MPNALCRRRETCRLCGSDDLALAIALAPTPPANAFVDDPATQQSTYPLDVFFCNACTHVQLLDVVDPRELFENYVYVSGTSPVFVAHFRRYAEHVIESYAPTHSGPARVLDIGSNDGTLLSCFKDLGCTVLGVDPARDIAEAATARGIETVTDFFSPDVAAKLRTAQGAFDVITANNVFAHADDLDGIAAGIATLLADDGVFVFEVSYLLDVIEHCLFDTIYHEHVAYHALTPLVGFFKKHGLHLIDAERVDTHGGSLRGTVARIGSSHDVKGRVAEMVALEHTCGLNTLETYHAFAGKIDSLRDALTGLLTELKAGGAKIAAFGAPAKATTLMYHFAIGPELIDFVVDDSTLKQGLFTPGLHIPVVPSDHMYDQNPDYVVVLAWNFADAIIAKHQKFRDNGGKFIVPIPKLKVV